ncbi:hypothetical protein BJ684DRAFT_935, partial [Piptocephalis cylindrospora]
AHMAMTEPPCRGHPGTPGYTEALGNVNYDADGPLNSRDPAVRRPYPCQGYKKGRIQRHYQAGASVSTRFTGTDNHQGGHCQFALSYDEGKVFVVIHTIIG